jgi:hypothetical protein
MVLCSQVAQTQQPSRIMVPTSLTPPHQLTAASHVITRRAKTGQQGILRERHRERERETERERERKP